MNCVILEISKEKFCLGQLDEKIEYGEPVCKECDGEIEFAIDESDDAGISGICYLICTGCKRFNIIQY